MLIVIMFYSETINDANDYLTPHILNKGLHYLNFVQLPYSSVFCQFFKHVFSKYFDSKLSRLNSSEEFIIIHHFPVLITFYLGVCPRVFFFHYPLSDVMTWFTSFSFISFLTLSIYLFFVFGGVLNCIFSSTLLICNIGITSFNKCVCCTVFIQTLLVDDHRMTLPVLGGADESVRIVLT